jgi:hypothetical protein
MPFGPGKYDDLCTDVRTRARADAAIVIVINGTHGNGFSVQAPPEITTRLPELLEHMAAEIRRSFES